MKFKLDLSDKIEVYGTTLYRIIATASFSDVKEGDKGGFVEKEGNLNQSGNAWVSGDARVYGDAWVYGNAQVYGDAWVYGNARVSGDAWVYGNARVSGNAQVYGDAWVYGNARVSGDAWVSGDARVSGDYDLLVITPIGSRKAPLTICKQKDGTLRYTTGCFYGTEEELLSKINDTHGDNNHAKAYRGAISYTKSVLLQPQTA